jgi:hypothetical protein
LLALVYLMLGFIPPLAAGPLAGLVFIDILKRGKRWYLMVPFWVLLVLVNLLVMFWVVSSSGAWFPISSTSACLFTPVASIITVLIMRFAWRKLEATGGMDVARKRWFTTGLVLIPALQVMVFVAMVILAPWLCKVGLVICQDF